MEVKPIKKVSTAVRVFDLQTIQDMLHRFIGEVAQLPGAITDAMHFHARVTEAIAAKDADLAEREMVLHLFDVVGRIESNLKIDLDLETMCGVDLIQVTPNPAKPELKI